MPDYEKNFAYNVKRLRKAQGLTQKMLADAAGCSEKTVSKWEAGISVPYVDTLFKLTKILHTGIENLFVDAAQVYYLGIDGGGTKTALKLTDGDGVVLRTLEAASCNPYDSGMNAALYSAARYTRSAARSRFRRSSCSRVSREVPQGRTKSS